MRFTLFAVVPAILLACPVSANAIIVPLFELEKLAVRATHIVVATEGARIDGKLTVIESWKGDLVAGTQLRIPALAAVFEAKQLRLKIPRPKKPRLTFEKWLREEANGTETIVYDVLKHVVPTHVTGKRIVLFLIAVGDDQSRKEEVVTWKAASSDSSYGTSIGWIEDGSVWTIRQITNPGPVMVMPTGSEKRMKRRVSVIIERPWRIPPLFDWDDLTLPPVIESYPSPPSARSR